MKRSSHVALLVGGLSVAGVGAYAMMPARQECTPVNPAAAAAPAAPGAAVVVTDGKPAIAPGAPAQQNCRRTRWFGGTSSSTSSAGRTSGRGMFVPGWSTRQNRSGSNVGLAPGSRPASRASSRATTTSRSTTTSRGGFGSTGRSAGRSSS